MPVTTGTVSTSDGYTDAATLGPFQRLASVNFTVANAVVAAQVAKLNEKDNSLHWDEFETTFVPGQGGYSGKIYGIRFRSYKPGSPAVVAVNGFFSDDPVPFNSPLPSSGTLTPDGGYTGPGILFDQPNVGGSLEITVFGAGTGMVFTVDDDGGYTFTNAGNGPFVINNAGDGGIQIEDNSDPATGGIDITSTGGDIHLHSDAGQIYLEDQGTGILLYSSGDPGDGVGIRLDAGGTDIVLGNTGGGDEWFHGGYGPGPAFAAAISFFGQTPQIQQPGAGVTTVAQLVTILQGYGLLS